MTTNTTTNPLAADLAARWVPSPEQIAAADAFLEAHPTFEYVYTIHILPNKTYGMWTTDVEIVNDDTEIFIDRIDAWNVLAWKCGVHAETHDLRRVSGGYTIHRRGSEWAVFEDIGSVVEN